MSTLRDYYHLRKDAFAIDPRDDAEVYFGGADLNTKIRRRIISDFVQPRGIPKFFVYGRYGGGKTHTLGHIEYVLRTDPELATNYPTVQIRFELPPIRAKERWLTLHRHFIDAIGLPLIREAISSVLSGAGPTPDPIEAFKRLQVLRYGDASLQNSQAQIFRNLIFGGRQATLSWEWLKGRSLKVDEAQMLGTETNLGETSDYVACLLNLGSLISKGFGKKVVFLVDEGEQLRGLTNTDSIFEFEFAIRRLVDNDNNVLGLVMAYQTEAGMGAAPRVLEDEAIRRRVGYEGGYLDLASLVAGPEDAKNFILDVLRYLVDQDVAKATIQREGLAIEPEFFPFTPEAIDAIAEFVTVDPDKQLPSQIITRLSDAVVEGWQRRKSSEKHVIIDETIAGVALYPEEA